MYTSLRSLLMVPIFIFFLTTFLFIGISLAQEQYPSSPVTMVVPYAAGMIDTITRALCKAAEKELGQPIIVENKPGATGGIGMNYVVRAKPDGYTLGTTTTSTYIQTPHLQKFPFNVLTDVTDIIVFAKYNYLLCVRADSPWNSYEDFIGYAKKNPGKITYGIPGIASATHICMERIAMKEGIKWTAIPFKSGGESVIAALGGHINATTQSSVETSAHVKAGKLRPLLILTDSRLPDLPNVSTILEKGYGFGAITYASVIGPKRLPEPISQKLESVFEKAMKTPSFVDTMKHLQIEIFYMSGKEYSNYWRSNYEIMGKVIKTLGFEEK